MKFLKEYIGDETPTMSPLERLIYNQIRPKIEACNRGILEVSILKDLGEALVCETSRSTNTDKRILKSFVEGLYEKYLDEVLDTRYSEKDIEKFAAQHRASLLSKPETKPSTTKPSATIDKKAFAVMHHDGKMWKVTPHSSIEDAAKDYAKKSAAAKKTGNRVKIIGHEGNVIHSTN